MQTTIGKGTRWKFSKKAPTPMMMGFEPELDKSLGLWSNDHTFNQELIGMLRWVIELGQADILFEASRLSQYQLVQEKDTRNNPCTLETIPKILVVHEMEAHRA